MKAKRKRRLLSIFIVLAAAGGGAWWTFAKDDTALRDETPTATVTRRDLSSSVLATGVVKPQIGAEVRVGARVSGKVERLLANIGDAVERGQAIAELEKADLEAKVRQREAECRLAEARLSSIKALQPRRVKKAEAETTQWQASVELYEKEFRRQEDLLAREISSQQDCDRSRQQLAVGQAKLAASQQALALVEETYRENVKQAEAESERAAATLADARVQLSYATIAAPIDGVIASVATQEGETVAAGLSAPTFVTIVDLDRLQLDTFVDEVDIGKIQLGQHAVFTVDAYPDREFRGTVSAIYPNAVIQNNVVNYDVVVTITSDYGGLLRPEMTANVTVMLETQPDALTVPLRALQRQQGRNLVYVSTARGPEAREVKTGRREGRWVEILDGLSEGESILLEPPSTSRESEEAYD